MKHTELWSRIEGTIAKHDLLQHPFYQAWTEGKLRTEDLRRYACDYYHQVSAFPTYLSTLHARLADGPLRRAVLSNLCEEEIEGTPHSELWLDFAEGMGAQREEVRASMPSESTQALVDTFREIAAKRSPLAALGAFYAYESQVARIAGTKAEGLRDRYAADDKTCNYFTLHATWDINHSKVWANQIDNGLEHVMDGESLSDERAEEILGAVEDAAVAMWNSLDGIHAVCCAN